MTSALASTCLLPPSSDLQLSSLPSASSLATASFSAFSLASVASELSAARSGLASFASPSTSHSSSIPFAFPSSSLSSSSGTPSFMSNPCSFTLDIVQNPVQARASGWGTRADARRPVDPPPVINLYVYRDGDDVTACCANTFILHASLYAAHMSSLRPPPGVIAPIQAAPQTTNLIGKTITSLNYMKHPPPGRAYFLFQDLSVRQEGTYRIVFSLFEICDSSTVWRAQAVSDILTVYSPKRFPGLDVSSALTREIASQGGKVRIRREARTRAVRRAVATVSASSSSSSSSSSISSASSSVTRTSTSASSSSSISPVSTLKSEQQLQTGPTIEYSLIDQNSEGPANGNASTSYIRPNYDYLYANTSTNNPWYSSNSGSLAGTAVQSFSGGSSGSGYFAVAASTANIPSSYSYETDGGVLGTTPTGLNTESALSHSMASQHAIPLGGVDSENTIAGTKSTPRFTNIMGSGQSLAPMPTSGMSVAPQQALPLNPLRQNIQPGVRNPSNNNFNLPLPVMTTGAGASSNVRTTMESTREFNNTHMGSGATVSETAILEPKSTRSSNYPGTLGNGIISSGSGEIENISAESGANINNNAASGTTASPAPTATAMRSSVSATTYDSAGSYSGQSASEAAGLIYRRPWSNTGLLSGDLSGHVPSALPDLAAPRFQQGVTAIGSGMESSIASTLVGTEIGGGMKGTLIDAYGRDMFAANATSLDYRRQPQQQQPQQYGMYDENSKYG
ncbi:velvet factor-domain-containing protein [Lipomyces oligophaga]|uniref:velvet factor-domain-containing protein n=1 Tax=Lipomyces oligophaga TaxID=45792 RepID=UPI0034CFD29B